MCHFAYILPIFFQNHFFPIYFTIYFLFSYRFSLLLCISISVIVKSHFPAKCHFRRSFVCLLFYFMLFLWNFFLFCIIISFKNFKFYERPFPSLSDSCSFISVFTCRCISSNCSLRSSCFRTRVVCFDNLLSLKIFNHGPT